MRQVLRAAPEGKKKALRLSPAESRLFLKLNRNLSDDRQQRYDELTEKRLAGKLTADALGAVEAERFISLVLREKFDYTT